MSELMVLHVADPEKVKAMFEALGLEFVQEQHGKGPIHWSSSKNGTIVEIYPKKSTMSADVHHAEIRFH